VDVGPVGLKIGEVTCPVEGDGAAEPRPVGPHRLDEAGAGEVIEVGPADPEHVGGFIAVQFATGPGGLLGGSGVVERLEAVAVVDDVPLELAGGADLTSAGQLGDTGR